MAFTPPKIQYSTNFFKKIGFGITLLFVLYTSLLWYNYIDDKEYKSSYQNCVNTTGNKAEYKECIDFPNQKHATKKADATLYTVYTILTPIIYFSTMLLYKFFFLTKRVD